MYIYIHTYYVADICVYVYISLYICMYIYIYIERERDIVLYSPQWPFRLDARDGLGLPRSHCADVRTCAPMCLLLLVCVVLGVSCFVIVSYVCLVSL